MSGIISYRNLRVFLSYSSKDKKLVGDIKQSLESLGFEVFLAHEDIEPSLEWQEEIIKNLRTCDIFIPIVNENYKKSNWTDQESGFAVALEKLVVPIDVGLVPYGFIGKYQALKLGDNIQNSCRKVKSIVRTHHRFKEFLDNNSVKAFVDSTSFNEANRRVEGIEILEPFTPSQINEIVKGYLSNDQVRGAFRARPKVVSWFKKYKEHIQPELVVQFDFFNIRDKDKRNQAVEKLVIRYLEENDATTDLEFIKYFDLSNILISNALKKLVDEGTVELERKEIDGEQIMEYRLTIKTGASIEKNAISPLREDDLEIRPNEGEPETSITVLSRGHTSQSKISFYFDRVLSDSLLISGAADPSGVCSVLTKIPADAETGLHYIWSKDETTNVVKSISFEVV